MTYLFQLFLTFIFFIASSSFVSLRAHSSESTAETLPSERVTIGELFQSIQALVPEIAKSQALQKDYQTILKEHSLKESAQLYADYVRVRIAFEATRAGGLWGVAWRITDQEPRSDLIWKQWQLKNDTTLHPATAIAECDELSALVAFVAHQIGLSQHSEVGMFWPTSNHTVAVWTILHSHPVRIVLPTSQIFLNDAQSLDTKAFDPWKQKTIFNYRRQDISLNETLPRALVRYFVTQIRDHAGRSQAELQTIRNAREQMQR